MAHVTDSIEVERPRQVVYDQWTQFEAFPRFMEGVVSVEQLDDTHLHWVADVGGRTKEWDAEIREQRPSEVIAWASLSGAQNDGRVTFETLDGNRTRVTLDMDVEPEGAVESAGTAVGLLERRIHGDLERFRDFIEQREAATGAWRGSVNRTS